MRLEPVHDLLDGDNRTPRRQNGLFLHPDNAFDEDVALAIGLEGMDEGDVGIDGRHGGQNFAGERTGDLTDLRIHLRQIGANITAKHGKRQFGGTGLIRMRQRGMRMLDDLDPVRPAVLQRVAEPPQQAYARVSGIGEHHLADTPHADHLIVDDVRRHTDDGKISALLAYRLMRRSIGHEVGESFERRRHPIFQMGGNRLPQRHEFRHDQPSIQPWIGYSACAHGCQNQPNTT